MCDKGNFILFFFFKPCFHPFHSNDYVAYVFSCLLILSLSFLYSLSLSLQSLFLSNTNKQHKAHHSYPILLPYRVPICWDLLHITHIWRCKGGIDVADSDSVAWHGKVRLRSVMWQLWKGEFFLHQFLVITGVIYCSF